MVVLQGVPNVRPRLRRLGVEKEEQQNGLMPHGETGEPSLHSIPFQVIFFFIFYSDFQFFDMDLLYLVLDDILLIRGSFLCLRVYKVCISCRDCLLCREGLFDWLLKALFLGASFWIIYYNCHFFFNFFWLVLFISAGFKLATTSSLFPKLCNCRTMPKHY